MFCPHCGTKLDDGAVFCNECGSKVADLQSQPVSASAASPVIPAAEPVAVPAAEAIPSAEPVAAPIAQQPVIEITPAPAEEIYPSPVAANEPVFGASGYAAVPPAAEVYPTVQPAAESYPNPQPSYAYPQAAEAYPTEQQSAAKPVKAKKKPMGAGGTIALCIVFGLLIFLFLFIATALFSARTIFAEERISHAIADSNLADVEIGDILMNDDISAQLKDEGVDVSRIDEETTLSEFIALCFTDAHMKSDGISDLVEETKIMNDIGNIVAAYERYILTGEDSEPLSAKKLLALVDKYSSDIYRYTNIDVSEYSNDIKDSIEGAKSDIKKANPDYLFGGAGKYTSMVLSLASVITAAVFALLFAVLLGVITKRFAAPTMTLGICCTLDGALFALSTLFSPVAMLDLPFGRGIRKVITSFADSVFAPVSTIGLIVLGAGVVLIVVAAVTAALAKKKQAKS